MELPATWMSPPHTVRGVHQFEIVGYSLIKGASPGEYVRFGSLPSAATGGTSASTVLPRRLLAAVPRARVGVPQGHIKERAHYRKLWLRQQPLAFPTTKT
jgi:hypothetical protein